MAPTGARRCRTCSAAGPRCSWCGTGGRGRLCGPCRCGPGGPVEFQVPGAVAGFRPSGDQQHLGVLGGHPVGHADGRDPRAASAAGRPALSPVSPPRPPAELPGEEPAGSGQLRELREGGGGAAGVRQREPTGARLPSATAFLTRSRRCGWCSCTRACCWACEEVNTNSGESVAGCGDVGVAVARCAPTAVGRESAAGPPAPDPARLVRQLRRHLDVQHQPPHPFPAYGRIGRRASVERPIARGQHVPGCVGSKACRTAGSAAAPRADAPAHSLRGGGGPQIPVARVHALRGHARAVVQQSLRLGAGAVAGETPGRSPPPHGGPPTPREPGPPTGTSAPTRAFPAASRSRRARRPPGTPGPPVPARRAHMPHGQEEGHRRLVPCGTHEPPHGALQTRLHQGPVVGRGALFRGPRRV